MEVAICVLKHAFSILSIQVFKGGALRRRGGGRPGRAKCDRILSFDKLSFTPQDDEAGSEDRGKLPPLAPTFLFVYIIIVISKIPVTAA